MVDRESNAANLGFENKLWEMADKLRGHMDASEYKHVVLGLIFLKYISDAFQAKYEELKASQETEYADPEDRDEYLAAIGEIERFEKPGDLVGYAGLGASVYISGQKHTTGRITKAGRKDLRSAMVAAARAAVRSHPHWKAEYERYCRRMAWQKAVVAVARRLLIVVWQVLHERVSDKYGDPEKIASSLFAHAYRVGVKNLPDGMSARQFVRWALDEMGHTEVERFRWGSKWVTLPEELLAKE